MFGAGIASRIAVSVAPIARLPHSPHQAALHDRWIFGRHNGIVDKRVSGNQTVVHFLNVHGLDLLQLRRAQGRELEQRPASFPLSLGADRRTADYHEPAIHNQRPV